MDEYVTFFTETSTGEQVEMAVLSEFEYDGREYVAAALVEGDTVKDDGVYIYHVKNTEEFAVEKLRNKFEYDSVSRAYVNMLEELEE